MDGDGLLERIAEGRTDLVWITSRGGTLRRNRRRTPLLQWCAYYGDVSALRFLVGHRRIADSLWENSG